MKLSFLLFAAAASLLALGQDLFEKAPPDVDDALRGRVKEFFQSHIDGKFRQAEKYVSEESQEFFYQVQKQRYESCETLKIAYTDDFTKATVTEVCKGKWNIGGTDTTVSMPMTSRWVRKVGAEWFWTHVQPESVPTPFGTMNYGIKPVDPAAAPAPGPALGTMKLPTDVRAANEMLMKQVTVDKDKIQLSSFEESSDTITVTNNSGGKVEIKFEYEAVVPGFTAKFDRELLAPGEKAVLSLRMVPKNRVAKPTIQARLLVESLLQQFPVTITFAVPPEVEKLLPKKK